MGGALLNGWLSKGLDPKKITVVDPHPSEWLVSLKKNGLKLNTKSSIIPEVCVIAVKPQVLEELLSENNFEYDSDTLFISILAGIKLQKLNKLLLGNVAVARVMPNIPATIGKGVSCLVANKRISEVQIKLAETLFSVVGKTIRLTDEEQMDAVTAISGSGPAYVFYLIEALSKVGIEFGLDQGLANRLAVLTVSGAGLLAEDSKVDANELRANVTSPNGTTEAALNVLMDSQNGLLPLIRETVSAARARSKNLGS